MNNVRTDHCFLADIDFADRTFPFSYGALPARLEKSIATAGLLQPPLLVAGKNGFRIVCGWRRLEVLRKLADESGEDEILVNLAKNISLQELFRRALWENLAIREFNLVETADIYCAALKIFTLDEVEKKIMPALKIPLRPRFRGRCQAISGFSQELRDLLAAGSVDAETVDLIKEWSADERSALIDLVTESGLRRNKLREVVGRLDDLARRDQISPFELLADVRQAALDEAGNIDVELLRRQLKARLYPQLTAAHLEFVARQEKFPWLKPFRLDPPPDFEGGDYRLNFTFTDSKEWEEICAQLNAVALEDIDELCRRS
ncbi:MAG: ParB-like nuclease domain-containing protein [Deltaproteobacteria bacterium]|nr:ParB-like nuclease domain-containing protein [Candidatus Tharpella aukensis]